MELKREFFYEEVRDGFYIPSIMKRAWGAGLTILSEVDRICRKYEIPYYAGYGTLLGAVRSSSFIPWDDDIDLMMLRSDYNRFLSVAEKELPEELALDVFIRNSFPSTGNFPTMHLWIFFPLMNWPRIRKRKDREKIKCICFFK